MHEVKLAIETLSKRSKEGSYPSQTAVAGQRVDRLTKTDPHLGVPLPADAFLKSHY